MSARQDEVDRNFAAFREQLPQLLVDHAGKHALMRNEQVVEYFDTSSDAMRYGYKFYDDGVFSVQVVADERIDLGWYSHAVCHADV